MARFQPNFFVLVTLVTLSCSLTGSTLAQGLPPALPFGTGQQICDYKYAIPSGEDCSKYAPALQQTLDAVQRDMDRVKLQFVSQNTVLLEEIRKLKEEVRHWTGAGNDDLTVGLTSLVTAFLIVIVG